MRGFQQEMPNKNWTWMHGKPGYSCGPEDGCYPTEKKLSSLLSTIKIPVARATHGHITVVAGCRTLKSESVGGSSTVVEYRVVDSLQDPKTEIWMNYTLLTRGPPPGKGDGPWQNTYYSIS